MKRLIAVVSSLLVLPAFAEIAPEYYYADLMAQYADQMPDAQFIEDEIPQEPESEPETDVAPEQPVTPVVPTAVSPRNASGRSAASRAVVSNTTTSARNVAARNVTNANVARSVTTRPTTVSRTNTTTSRAATTTASRASTARATATNTVSNRPSVTVRSTGNVAAKQTPGVTSRNASKTNANTARASIVQTDTVNTPLYISSRVGVTNPSNVTTRVPTIRVGSATTATTSTTTSSETVSSTASIDELAQLTDYCKAQYVACMDNFCNVLDDNQGRCSCSANLDNYAETEAALKQATEDLQDVALQIQYIGLSADQVETLFTQTEAELEMQSSSDNSQLKNDLDKIKNMIVDVKSGTPTTSTGMSFDLSGLLDFTIDSTGFDLSSLLGSMSGNNNSISNQRGDQLYDTASARCKAAVLNSCAAQGVDTTIITNSYDLEIDKACIQYERALTESNEQMSATVRNAKSVLQRARLMVAQQKNQYDLRGCVNALDTCMQDDFVCGDNYENCLDPTGKYIVNGEVVVGSTPGAPGDIDAAIYDMWDYGNGNNAWGMTSTTAGTTDGTRNTLADYISTTVTDAAPRTTSSSVSEFLQNKIGYHDDSDGKNYGMCMSVLNMCQDVTYTGSGQNAEYNPQNNVIKEFLNRTLVQIKSSQDTILADYAEECITDVASCLAQNNYDADEGSGSATLKQKLYAKSGSKCEEVSLDYILTNLSSGASVYTDSKCETGSVTVNGSNLTTYISSSGMSAGNKVAMRACNPIITTCMSVNKVTPAVGQDTTLSQEIWIQQVMGN